MQPEQLLKIRKQYKHILSCQHLNANLAQTYVSKIKGNVYYLAEILEITEKILNDAKISQLYKMNCLMMIKLIVQTADCVTVTLIQVYLLPLIQRIAITGIQSTNYSYYQSLGYTQNQVIEGYQKLSGEIIKIGSAVKPFRMYQCIQLAEASQFSKSLDKISVNATEALIIDRGLEQTYNKTFVGSSKNFQDGNASSQQFIKYYMGKTAEIIESGPKSIVNLKDGKVNEKCNLKTMLKNGSYHINFDVLALCVDILETNDNIAQKANALHLISEMISWGDVEALLLVNYSGLIENIVVAIYQDKKGYKIFKEIEGQKQQKQRFLQALLRNIQVWATCNPYDNILNKQNKYPSNIIKVYNNLKNQETSILFPNNPFLKTISNEFSLNQKNNSELNEKILEDMHYQSMSAHNRMSSSSFYRSDTFLYTSLKEKVENVIKALDKLSENDQVLFDQNKLIKQMCKQANKIKKDLEVIIDNDMSFTTNNELIIEQGTQCMDIVNQVDQKFRQYREGQISWEQFKDILEKSKKKLKEIKINQESIEDSRHIDSMTDSIKMFFSHKLKGVKPHSSVKSIELQENVKSSFPIRNNHNHEQHGSLRIQSLPFKTNQASSSIILPDDLKISDSMVKQKSQLSNHKISLEKSNSHIQDVLNPQKLEGPEYTDFLDITKNISSDLVEPEARNIKRVTKMISQKEFKIKSPSPYNKFNKKSRSKDNTQILSFNRERQNKNLIGPSLMEYYPDQQSKNAIIKKNKQNKIVPLKSEVLIPSERQNDEKKAYKSEEVINEKLYQNYIYPSNDQNKRNPEKLQKQPARDYRRRIFSRNSSNSRQKSSADSLNGSRQRKKIFSKLSRNSNNSSNKQNETTSNFIIPNTEEPESHQKQNTNKQNKNDEYYSSNKHEHSNIEKKKNDGFSLSLGNHHVKTSLSMIPSQNVQSFTNKQFISHQTISEEVIDLVKYQKRLKKKFLRHRNLIIKNQDLEIGSILQKNDQNIEIAYYITPYKSLETLNTYYEDSPELNIHLEDGQYTSLKVNKQYKVNFRVNMLQYKFKLPQIKFKYKTQESGRSSTLKTILPIPSTRFLEFIKLGQNMLKKQFCEMGNQQHQFPHLCTQIIPLEASVLKRDQSFLFDYLPIQKFHELENGTVFYGTGCSFKGKNFLLKVVAKKNQFICFQGKANSRQGQKLMLHCLCELQKLFEGQFE